jgi:hypothetical protein
MWNYFDKNNKGPLVKQLKSRHSILIYFLKQAPGNLRGLGYRLINSYIHAR